MNIKMLYKVSVFTVFMITVGSFAKAQNNTLTAKEKKEGWKLLFDGKTSKGWRSAKSEAFPTGSPGWVVKDGTMTIQATNGAESQNAGDIVTIDEYGPFEMSFDFKLTRGATAALNTLLL